jgi:hypothetical protein
MGWEWLFPTLTGIGGVIAGATARPIIERLLDPLLEYIRDLQIAPRETFRLTLSAKYDDLAPLASFRFILVQYGPNGDEQEDFVQRLAPGQQADAKLQNRYGPVKLEKDSSGRSILIFKLPIHRSIGTLFKLFALPKAGGDLNRLREKLEAPCRDEIRITPGGDAVWFLLKRENPEFKRFQIKVTTPPGRFENNFVMPRRGGGYKT